MGRAEGPANWDLEILPFGMVMPKQKRLIVRKRKRGPGQITKPSFQPEERPEPRRLGLRISPIAALSFSLEERLLEQGGVNPDNVSNTGIEFSPPLDGFDVGHLLGRLMLQYTNPSKIGGGTFLAFILYS